MSLDPLSARPSHEKYEMYEGGSAEAERVVFEKLARDIMSVQAKVRQKTRARDIRRAFHGKAILGITGAELRVVDHIRDDYRVGYFQPGKKYSITVRLSNASGAHGPDFGADLRGVAVRVEVSDKEYHDLLATNSPFSHARNAQQFVAFAVAMAGSKLLFIPRLFASIGRSETVRILRNVMQSSHRPVRSLALETYWSGTAILWGPAGPVRYLLCPSPDAPHAPEPSKTDPDYLHHEMADRLRAQDVVFDLFLQPFASEEKTPIEDATKEWSETNSPPVHVATLIIPKQDIDCVATRNEARLVDEIAFNPWNTTDEFRPLGNLNRARKAVYDASAAHRNGYRFLTHIPLHNVIAGKFLGLVFKALNWFIPWYRLCWWRLSLLNLIVFRDQLRARNLIDTEKQEAPPRPQDIPMRVPESARTVRTFDGSYNDLSDPQMGAVGSTFGRNMTPNFKENLYSKPDPIVVSRELMHRRAFLPAPSLNLLAAAWIQFQVHDWVNHSRYDLGEYGKDIVVHLPKGKHWRSHRNEEERGEMRIAGNKFREGEAGYPVFENITTPWWDGSEVYGADKNLAQKLRDGARIRLDENGYLPEDIRGRVVTGFNESWWLGLGIFHTLFAREHNVVCHELSRAYPLWDDERVYQSARLIISALIAKIHTVEWTPAILATKTIDVGLNASWYGAPKDALSQLFIWLLDTHALKGIPETLPDHHTARYSLTEEFVAVYRLHPLIPDDYQFLDYGTGRATHDLTFDDIQGEAADNKLREIKLNNSIYSFGVTHPGAITLHNYPESLRRFERQNGEIIDLSVVDIVRDRRRGVPRYNDFREAVHKPRVRHWKELSNNPETVQKLRDIYKNIDEVDTMVGLHAEPAPEGFGFSDTAFRIFILMASRRLQSDRFLTIDFRPEVYSPLGIDWVQKNGMTSVILRHCPELAATLPRNGNAFAPWRPSHKSRPQHTPASQE